MIDFKNAVEHDIHRVFINDLEFADNHVIDGVIVSCVVDKDTIQGAQGSFEGVFTNTITIHVAVESLGRVPVEGEVLMLDGQILLIRSVSIEMGMFAIVCEANEQ